MRRGAPLSTACLLLTITFATDALSQYTQAPPQQPPPGASPQPYPPPQYQPQPYPPPQYQPQPGQPGYGGPQYQPPPPQSVPDTPSSPAVLEYEDGQAIPANYHLVTKTRGEFLYGGLAFFALTYGTAVYVASLGSLAGGEKLGNFFVPVAGPFLEMSDLNSKGAGTFWLAFWGICQGAGVGAAIYGITSPRKLLYRNDLGNVSLQVTPVITGKTQGLMLIGSF